MTSAVIILLVARLTSPAFLSRVLGKDGRELPQCYAGTSIVRRNNTVKEYKELIDCPSRFHQLLHLPLKLGDAGF